MGSEQVYADYCMLVVKVTSLLMKAESALEFSFGVRALTEMNIWCVKGMLLGFKGF